MTGFYSYFAVGITLTGLLASSVSQADTTTDAIRNFVLHNTKNIAVTDVKPTPIPTVYEVVANGEILYVDATGRYAFVEARLVDLQSHQDLTQATQDRLSQIDFATLPKDLAIKQVNGNGRRQLAIFADPMCPVCHQLAAGLDQLRDVTIYTYTIPIISPESAPASVAIWCVPPRQRLARWQSFMAGEATPKSAPPSSCTAAKDVVSKIVTMGERFQINNTPTLVFPNNQRIVGAMPIEELDAALDEAMGARK